MKNYSGNTINQYYLANHLGQGGMVVVYKAFDTSLNRDVVVKLIRTEDLDGNMQAGIYRRFPTIMRELSQLTHANIVPILDFGFYEDVPYFVAENLPGGSLKQRMRRPLTLSSAIRVLAPAAEALSYAHQHGVLHQDFKPSNVLFHNEDKRPMVTDLGIAALFIDSSYDPSLLEVGFGTPSYMAPEQWHGDVDAQSDVYSMGIVFYEMLTGETVNRTETPLAAAFKQYEGIIPDPTLKIRTLAPNVQHFFYKCLAVEKRNRFQTMDEMKGALEGLTDPPSGHHIPGGAVAKLPTPQVGEQPIAAAPMTTEGNLKTPPHSEENPSLLIPTLAELSPKVVPPPTATPVRANDSESVRPQALQPSTTTPGRQAIQEDFKPRTSPDGIKPRSTSRPVDAPPKLQVSGQPASVGQETKRIPRIIESDSPSLKPTGKHSYWVTALVLGVTVALAQALKVVLIEQLEVVFKPWSAGVIASVTAWLISGLAIYLYYRLTTDLKVQAEGIAAFVLAGLFPAVTGELVSAPYGQWISHILLWMFLGLGMGILFHGMTKLPGSRGLALIGGWTQAGAISGLPVLVYFLLNQPSPEVPRVLYLIQGLLLGGGLGISLVIAFQDHFKKSNLYKVIFAIWCSAAGGLAGLVIPGPDNNVLQTGISWLIMTSMILAGVGLFLTRSGVHQTNPTPLSHNSRVD